MMLAVGLFRECWGVKQPTPKALKSRARQLGYHYARLHFIGGNWWLSLAITECCDMVLSLSAELGDCNDAWILAKYGQGPLLIRWHQGRLSQVSQQPLAACTKDFERSREQAAATQCLRYGWTESVPEPWTKATEISVSLSQQPLLPLEQLHRMPAYRSRRRRSGMFLGIGVLGAIAVSLWLFVPHAEHPTQPAEQTELLATKKWLTPTQIIDAVSEHVTPRWQGVWQVTQVGVSGTTLLVAYSGQTPLAWHSANADDNITAVASNSVANLQRSRQVTLLPQPYHQREALKDEGLPELLRALVLAQGPSLQVTQQNNQLIIRWQEWSLLQLAQLARWLEQRNLWTHSASFIAATQGWNGKWVLTNGHKEAP